MLEHPLIGGHPRREQRAGEEQQRNEPLALGQTVAREEAESEREQKTHMHGARDQGRERREGRRVELKKGESHRDEKKQA